MDNCKVVLIILLLVSCSEEMDIQSVNPQETNTLKSAYGIDGLNQAYLSHIALLGDGISGVNGISWDEIEPNAPENGVHDYRLKNEMMALKSALSASNRKLQLNFRLSSNWALVKDPNNQVTNPENGSSEDGILGVAPSHEQNLAAVIEYILTNLNVEALQVGSEAENEWLNGIGYVHALSIIYRTAKAIQPEVKVMAFGFNPANYFIKTQNFDEDLISEKLDFVQSVLKNGEGYYDVFSIHTSREHEAIPPTVNWIENEMLSNGYTKPIWVDDMYSAPWLDPDFGTENEKRLYHDLIGGNANAIMEFDSLQADYMIKKIAVGFASGVEKIFVSTDVDFENYYIPNWRFAGILKSNGERKPAYYNLKLLIEKTDGFDQVLKRGDHLYEFMFADRPSIHLYWIERSESEDLALLNSDSYTVHEFAYRFGETPKSKEIDNLEDYFYTASPILIELN